MEFSDLEKIRVEKIERMRANGIEPYPTRVSVTHSIGEAIRAFEASEKVAEGETPQPVQVCLAGRMRSMRLMGKLIFAHIEDGTGRVQLFLRVNELGEPAMERFRTDFDLGDFVQANGTMMRTRSGEVSLLVLGFEMLAKAITPLPAAKDEMVDGKLVRHATLADAEMRFRQRYADLAVNPEVRQTFRIRAAITRAIRAVPG
jgi:lysyl-tRNA synthetase, class II